jgi:hypothetical protein
MKLRIVIVLGWIGLALTDSSRAEDLAIAGKVVGADGTPIASAEVAPFWTSRNDSMQSYQGTKSDANGRFSLKVPFYGRSVAVLALDKERKTGAILTADKESAAKEATLALGPLVRVKGSFFCPDLKQKPTWTNVYIMTPDGARVLGCDSQEANFSFLLPAGKYKFWGYGADIKNLQRDLTLAADKPELDLQTLNVPATVIAQHKGKTPPTWHVTDARGVKKTVNLADFKGKWVLVEFWGFW